MPQGTDKPPRWAQGFLWSPHADTSSPTANHSLLAEPLPAPPAWPEGQKTVASHPHLFRVSTPIQLDNLAQALQPHANRPLVESWLRGLRDGVWPFARPFRFPPPPIPANNASAFEHIDFVRATRDAEVAAGRWSPGFTEKLPDMRVSPLGVALKPHSTKLRLITDFSAPHAPHPAGYAVNDAFSKEDRAVQYDNCRHLGAWLRELYQTNPACFRDPDFVLWKADVASAFRLIPVHPLWQLAQVVCVDGLFHIDHQLVFGSATSPRVWCSFAGLILSIFRDRKGASAFLYVDDFFGADPLKLRLPRPFAHAQRDLLDLFDHLGIPYDLLKAPAGRAIDIIGLYVDLNTASIGISPPRRSNLLEGLRAFANQDRATVQQLRQLAGWISWASQAMPHVRPFTFLIYRTIGSFTRPSFVVPLSQPLRRDLRTIATIVEHHSGKLFLAATLWPLTSADLVAFVDACSSISGIGIYFPAFHQGWYGAFPIDGVHINTLEGSAVWLAWHLACAHLGSPNKRILIHSDNTAAVDVFEKLYSRSPALNSLVRSVAWTTRDFSCTLRVQHIPGAKNGMADALSRCDFARARSIDPLVRIHAADMSVLLPFAEAWQTLSPWSPL